MIKGKQRVQIWEQMKLSALPSLFFLDITPMIWIAIDGVFK